MPTIVFIGDSITDCDRRADALGLGHGYVDLVAAELRRRGDDATVINRGVAGDRVAHLQDRWQTDALDPAPDLLSVHIGVNDSLVAFFQGRPTPPEQFAKQYQDLLDRATAARLILLEPFYLGSRGQLGLREDLAEKQRIVADLAQRYGAAFVPLQEPMAALARERGPVVVAFDGIHPSPIGHRLIAEVWLNAYQGSL